jgi:FkbM family methyltransferase
VRNLIRQHPAIRAAARRVRRLGWAPPARSRPPEDRVVPIALPASGATEHGLLTMTLPSKLLVPRRLAQEGLAGYEPEALACFLAALDVAGPGAVLDVGANVGIYAALASALTRREVRAFEPSPSLVEAARSFAAANGLRYTTESLALGAENGSATFYLSDSSDTSNSLAAGFRVSSAQIEVPVETLDSYVARTGVVPAIMKVDTETTEPDVLAGAAKTITGYRPWVLCEVLAGRVEERLTEVLAPFGYHWYHVTGEVPYREADEIAGDRTHRYLMWLLAPERPGEDFWAALRGWVDALAECTPERGAQLQAAGSQTPG